MKPFAHLARAAWLGIALALLPLPARAQTATPTTTAAAPMPAMTATASAVDSDPSLPVISGVTVVADNDSVVLSWPAVSGAADYRVYLTDQPGVVKYAGLNYEALSDGKAKPPAVPLTQVQINGLTPGVAYQAVVQAVNALGPYPIGNVATAANGIANPASFTAGVSLLGANMGLTSDGLISTNGQGAPTNDPQVIAQSAPVTIEATGDVPIPSEAGATQAFLDTFPSATITKTAEDDKNDMATWSMVTSDGGNWTLQGYYIDAKDTVPFVADRHFMDVLYDGGTPGGPNPPHVGHGQFAMTPSQTADFSNGQILHVTMEVDTHNSARRWEGIAIGPASDPLLDFDEGVGTPPEPSGAVNTSNQAVFVQFIQNTLDVNVYGRDATGALTDTEYTGTGGSGTLHAVTRADGIGLDDRSRIDMFLSTTHFAVYQDGVCLASYDFTTPLPFSVAKVYFTHYLYHSGLGLTEIETNKPYETFWINDVQYSDERHWDNMGFEVLPADTAWASLPSLIGEFPPAATTTTTTATGSTTTSTDTGSTTGSTGATTSQSDTSTTTTGSTTSASGAGSDSTPPPTTTPGAVTGPITALTIAAGGDCTITIGGVSMTTADAHLRNMDELAYMGGKSVTATYTAGTPNAQTSVTLGP